MIYTVTMNPSIDYVIEVSSFDEGGLNRSQEEIFLPGGKGNNVSVVLKNLGIESVALGFIAGFTGDKIEAMLRERGVRTEFIKLSKGNSRMNVKMRNRSDGSETEINGGGPEIREADTELLMEKLCGLKNGDVLVLSGSIPSSVPDTIYEEICERLSGKGVRLVVDAEKQLLERVLKYSPYLIKPNHKELGDMFGVTIRTKEEAIRYAEKLLALGAQQVIVSMAQAGAVFLGKNGEVYQMDAPTGNVVNSVGSGDSMIAGFLSVTEGPERCKKQAGESVTEHAFRVAVAAGSACAFLKGLPHREDVENILKESGRE